MKEAAKRMFFKNQQIILVATLSLISIGAFIYFFQNGLGLAYNDARSHLNIGRRVVEGLQPGFSQLGSVWLPLFHVLMIPTIWNDFMWHSGLSGAIINMFCYVAIGILIYKFLARLGSKKIGCWVGVAVFALNPNILYLQSTAMTELLLLATMLWGMYYFFLWHKEKNDVHIINAAILIMLSTLVRYDGWFLLLLATFLMLIYSWKRKGYVVAEGRTVLFSLMGGFGILLWLFWNFLIFGDALYFAFGPYSAHSQQEVFAADGYLNTKGNFLLSIRTYLYAIILNVGPYISLLAGAGMVSFYAFGKLSKRVLFASFVFFAPLLFNVLALYLGHSILFIKGFSGSEDWFNIRYGVMMLPATAIFVGFLVGRAKNWEAPIWALFVLVAVGLNFSAEAVTVSDAKYGKSQKNVNEISGWLSQNASGSDEYILISAASHDSIIFSSGLPMKRFIHEGTGEYWDEATEDPQKWAKWIVLMAKQEREHDFLWKTIEDKSCLEKYQLVEKFPYASIYQLKDEQNRLLKLR